MAKPPLNRQSEEQRLESITRYEKENRMSEQGEVLSKETLDEFAALGRTRAAWAEAASQPSPAHDDDVDARTAAVSRLRSDAQTVGGAMADLNHEAERIRRDAPRRLALVEGAKQAAREREARHGRLAILQPAESPLADRGVVVGNPGDWNQLAEGGREAIRRDARMDRQGHRPEVVGGVDPDSREAEEAARHLGDGTGGGW